MAQQPREVQFRAQIPASVPPVPPTYATLCIINRVGQAIFFDFGYLDPLMLVTSETGAAQVGTAQPGEPLRAAHVARILMTEDQARKLRDNLDGILGMADGRE